MAAKASTATETRGLAGTVLAVVFIGILIGASYWVLLPFLPALVWATMVVISTWPLMLAAEEKLKGRRNLATMIMIAAFFLVFIVPLLLAISTIVDNADQITGWIRSASSFERPPAPQWLRSIPLAGPKLADKWNLLSASNKDDLITRFSPYMGDLLTWFIAQVGNVGMLLLHFVLTLALSAVLYMNGERAAAAVRNFASRLAGPRGEEAATLAAKAIRAVALGVVGTAMCQALVAGIGFVIAGIHQAVLLTALIFFFSVIQIGPIPVMVPLVAWLYYSGSPGWAGAMLLWTILITGMDNVLRPMLIRRGANLPLLLIFAGVIGGLIAFGIIGLFVGPVVLAVSYTLLNAWIAGPEAAA